MTEQERDRNNNAIDLLIALTVEELAKISGRDPSQLMGDFLRSRTAAILCDEETKLWWDGPSAIAEMYQEEIAER